MIFPIYDSMQKRVLVHPRSQAGMKIYILRTASSLMRYHFGKRTFGVDGGDLGAVVLESPGILIILPLFLAEESRSHIIPDMLVICGKSFHSKDKLYLMNTRLLIHILNW